MTEAACFRCDWQGGTRSDECPNCGAPLYRIEREPRRELREPLPGPAEPEPAAKPAVRRSGPWRSLAGLAAVAMLLGAVVSRAGPDRGGGSAVGSRPSLRSLHGSIVFASSTGGYGGGQRLFRVDLETKAVTLVASVPEVEELRPWGRGVLFSTRDEHGVSAFSLRTVGRNARARLLVSGDLLAWGPSGTSLVVASRGTPDRRGCADEVIRRLETFSGRVLDAFRDRRLCGSYLSVGADPSHAYYTRATHHSVGIYFAGLGVGHLVLGRYAMVSSSPTGDLLVVRVDPTPSGAPDGNAGPTPAAPSGALLYWMGRGGPVPFGLPTADLEVERVLAWSNDGRYALVVGDMGEGRSVYRLQGGAGTGRRMPDLIRDVPEGVRVGAAFGENGVIYLAVGGQLYAFVGGHVFNLGLTQAEPRPSGPIAWTP